MKIYPAFCLGALLLGSACCTVPSAKQADTPKDRYADTLLDIVPPEVMFAQLAWPYAQVYTRANVQEKAHSNFMRNVDSTELRRIIREALLTHFTEDELKALATFYTTPEGRACMAKTAAFASDVVPACAHEATKAFRKTAADSARGLLWP
jgi:hypothetical protein